MKIAVDARPLTSPLTGIGRYTHSLLRRLVKTDHDWFLYSDRPLLVELPSEENVTIRHGGAKGGTPGSLRWAQWQYLKWAKEDQIEVFWSPRHHLPLFLPSEIKTVVTIHDLVWKRFPDTMQKKNYWLEKLLMGPSINKADHIIAVSNFTASEIEHFYSTHTKKLSVIYEAAETSGKSGSLTPGIPENYYLFVGTLEPRKNLELLLNAYAQTEKIIPLVIAGASGWGNVLLEELINKLELEDEVHILGYVSDDELNRLYSNSHALLMPSQYEGFGLPAVEAMNHGVPCIVSSGTALEEICQNAALVVSPFSKQELTDAITSIGDPRIHSRLSIHAKARAQKFSWDSAMTETLAILCG